MVFYVTAAFMFMLSFLELCIVISNSNVLSKRSIYFKLTYATLFLFLIILCGLRAEGVDRDYPEYLSILSQVPPFPKVLFADLSNVHGDPIFYFIASMVNLFEGDSFVIFLIFALLSLSIYRWCFFKYSYLPFLSVFIYFCHSFLNKEMTQIRSGLSSAFILLLLCYLCDSRKFKAYFAFIFSLLSHSSGFVSVLLFFYKRIHYKNNIIFYAGIFLSYVLCFVWKPLFFMLPQNIGVVQKVSQYLAWDEYNYSLSLLNPVLLRQIFYFFIFLYVKDKCKWDEKMNVFLFSCFLSICIYIVFNDTAIIAARIASMLSSAEFILIPYSIVQLFKYKKTLLGCGVYLVTIISSLILLYGNLEIKDIFTEYKNIIQI